MESKIRYRLCYNYGKKLNADGRSPVAVEARQGTKRIYLSTQVMLFPDQWDNGMVVNHPNASKLTVWLFRRMHEIEEIELDSLLNDKPMLLSQLKQAVRSGSKPSASIEEFVNAVIEPSNRSRQTKDAYHTLARETEKYDKKTKMNTIDHDWIERWRTTMLQQGLSENTVKGRLKMLHCLTQEAIKRDLLSQDPFKWIVIGNMTPKQEFLTKDELRKIERVRLTGKEAKVRDLFLLGVYTGLRWSDLTTLEEADISGGIIRKRMYKTKRDVTIPIKTLFWGKGQEIVDRYQPITRLCKCVKCNSTGNRIIQAIAERIGIKQRVHFHLARKTCSTMLNALGLPTNDITTILGHTQTETTQKYYIFGKEESMIKSSKKIFRRQKESPDSESDSSPERMQEEPAEIIDKE